MGNATQMETVVGTVDEEQATDQTGVLLWSPRIDEVLLWAASRSHQEDEVEAEPPQGGCDEDDGDVRQQTVTIRVKSGATARRMILFLGELRLKPDFHLLQMRCADPEGTTLKLRLKTSLPLKEVLGRMRCIASVDVGSPVKGAPGPCFDVGLADVSWWDVDETEQIIGEQLASRVPLYEEASAAPADSRDELEMLSDPTGQLPESLEPAGRAREDERETIRLQVGAGASPRQLAHLAEGLRAEPGVDIVQMVGTKSEGVDIWVKAESESQLGALIERVCSFEEGDGTRPMPEAEADSQPRFRDQLDAPLASRAARGAAPVPVAA